jgi:hypothetical protein
MKQIILIILFLVFPLQTIAEQEEPIFSFIVNGTDCGNDSKSPLIETNLKNGELITSVKFSMNCAYVPHRPSFSLKENEVTFYFETFSLSGAMAKCVCDTTILFKLSLNNSRHAGIYKDNGKTPNVKVIMDGKEINP